MSLTIEKIEKNMLNKCYLETNTNDKMNNNQYMNELYSIVERLSNQSNLNTDEEKKITQLKSLIKSFGWNTSESTSTNTQETTYMDIYNYIIKGHDIVLKPTLGNVKKLLKDIMNEIKQKEKVKLPKAIDVDKMVRSIVSSLPESIEQDKLYSYLADYFAVKISHHHYYDILAAYISVKRLHNITSDSLVITAKLLQENLDKNGDKAPILSDETYNIILKHHEKLEAVIDYNRDFLFDYFGLKTLERSYLYKLHFTKYKIIERPQHMLMRVAIGIHGNDINSAIETYELLSKKYFTHATPTLFNAGTLRPQMSSCFLMAIDDNIESIFDTVRDIAFTSKWSGGIGVHLSALRARGSLIRGTNGLSSGSIPLCVMLDKLAKYVNQGGKRNGSIACYLEPWHPDIFDFCDLRKNTGDDDRRARDLFLALWVPSLFIKRVMADGVWSLMCPDECPGLNLVHSKEFDELYEKYERDGKYKKQVKARELWLHILIAQSETGFPYILYKDNANAKSNQQNLGTIRSSNLCAEIIEYSDENETAVCNLASICLPMYIEYKADKKTFNHKKLIEICRVIVRNLNKIIDRGYYPTEKTRISNMKHRPIGIGVQGLADLYNIMGYPFDSPEAYKLNLEIFETIYYACIDESKEQAKLYGHYSSFKGSPFSKGQLQFHLWGKSDSDLKMGYDWKKLIEEVKKYGTRNSLLTALMPTASTSQIMGNSECIEPYMSNIFKRSTLAGEFCVVNKNLQQTLENMGLWDEDMRKRLIIENGSVQNIQSIPDHVKSVYKTAFEIDQMHLVRQSAARGIFVDQSQSFNLFLANPDFSVLTSALIEGHELGNKTGIYYYRSLPAINPIQFGIDVEDIKRLTGKTSTIDMVSNSYNIVNEDKPKQENPETKKFCKWKPGMKLEDCLTCSS